MYRLYKQNDDISAYVCEFVADSAEDIKNLPKTAYPGSTCLVTSTSDVYILNAQKQWVKLS